ncbi:Protein RNA-directed DNA methylation 3 [Vitis vinifera]|uniref:Protein RNA-directed DNA methylation 3 n=1 Tax=Vitis vinifera TaxID=29760 RepID=A0A438BMS1_VITVI|nr:Protein RNA-directed DNA methylation 3 [Vitis vinifera]
MSLLVVLSLLCMPWWTLTRFGWRRCGILQVRKGDGILDSQDLLMIGRMLWKMTKNGEFSVKSLYGALRTRNATPFRGTSYGALVCLPKWAFLLEKHHGVSFLYPLFFLAFALRRLLCTPDFLEDGFNTGLKVKNEPGKAHNLPFFPKEEELSEEELEKMLEERYKDGSKFVTYAEDDYETKRSVQRNSLIPSIKDPTIWKVKCMVGRERLSAFCLMQKYVDLQSLGTKLQIISAFSVEHVKGFIYIEADKQCDINEIVVVSDAQKKATVKLIPRIDLQAMAEKFSGLFVALRIGSSDKGLGWDVGVSMFESYQGPKKREDRERK